VRPLRVLIVDDCRDTTDSTAELVGLWGHDSRRVYDGADALTVAAAYCPDVVLVDLVMRGVDGCAVARRVRRLPGMSDALLIAITGHTASEHRRHAAAAGFDFFLIKPVDPSTLEALLMSRQVEMAADRVPANPAEDRIPDDTGCDPWVADRPPGGPDSGRTAEEYREYRTTQEKLLMTQVDRLPAAPAAVSAPPADYRILVVDDDDGVRRFLAAGLPREGFAVRLAASGQEAADLLRASRPGIDVVLMDVRMPGRNGPETLAALRKQDPQVRCCFMSGDLGEHTEDGLRKLGTGAVLRKPFTMAEAGRVLREEIGRREAELATQDDHWRDDGGQGQRPQPRGGCALR
jgi:CheY-like chemotaxis protein